MAAAAAAAATKTYPLFDQKGKANPRPTGPQTGIWVKGFFHPGCCCKVHDPEQLWAKRSAAITAERQKEQAKKKKPQKATDASTT